VKQQEQSHIFAENDRAMLRHLTHTSRIAALFPALMFMCIGCGDFIKGDNGEGEIRWSFSASGGIATKVTSEIPDTNDFLLKVTDAKGKVLYSGTYGKSPESLLVSAGTYTVSVMSSDFSKPSFSAPQYGDTQVVVVSSGQTAVVRLVCTMMNCGIRLKIAPEFLTTHPSGALFVKSADGKLPYSYNEKRIAYFRPGTISVMMTEGSRDETIYSRSLKAQDILHLGISASTPSEDNRISILVDTTHNWISDNHIIGGGGAGGHSSGDAMSVSEAMDNSGENDVWVYGYIVGGDLTSSGSKMTTEAPFSKNTHLAIASRSSVTAKSSCIAVELKAGDIREALNLVDNPSNIGKRVFLRGDIVSSYYGITGIKNVTDYELR